MNTQASLEALDLTGWEAIYRRAACAGRGELVEPGEERLAATDELLAAVLPAATRAEGRLLAAAVVASDDVVASASLARQLAAVVRGLDCALAAHGRDTGYDVGAWREAALITARLVADEPLEAASLAALLDEALTQMAGVFVALRRDRLGVSERLADALGHSLVVYAVAEGLR